MAVTKALIIFLFPVIVNPSTGFLIGDIGHQEFQEIIFESVLNQYKTWDYEKEKVFESLKETLNSFLQQNLFTENNQICQNKALIKKVLSGKSTVGMTDRSPISVLYEKGLPIMDILLTKLCQSSSSSTHCEHFSCSAEKDGKAFCETAKGIPRLFNGLSLSYCVGKQACVPSFDLGSFNFGFQHLTECTRIRININCSFAKINISSVLNEFNWKDVSELAISNCGTCGVRQIEYQAEMKSLKYLNISDNQLEELPLNLFAEFFNLVNLDISSNQLSSLPSDIFFNQTSVERLNLASNKLQTLPRNVFSKLVALKELNLSGNKLATLPVTLFHNQNSLQFLNLSSNNLSTFPNSIPQQRAVLKILDLSSNRLSSLSGNSFKHHSGLVMLDLSSNQLSSLPNDIFRNNSALMIIDISYNNLSSLPVFKYSSQLMMLGLSSNRLSSLPANSFIQNSILALLDLSSNRLSSLPNDIFKNISLLSLLDLSSNKISYLPEDIFKHNEWLKALYLSSNRLSSQPKEIFASNTELLMLDLSSNRLSLLPGGIFPNLLNMLDLSSNRLTSLPRTLFKRCNYLVILDLSSNWLTSLSGDLFKHCTTLRTLDLSSNRLSTLPNDIFEDSFTLAIIHLSSNMLLSVPGDMGALTSLVYLNLSKNAISNLSTDAFLGLHNLQVLDLSYNNLYDIRTDTFNSLIHLSALIIFKNNILVKEGMFSGLENLETLIVDSYQICCEQPNSTERTNGCIVFKDARSASECVDRYEPLLPVPPYTKYVRKVKRSKNCSNPVDVISDCWNLIRMEVLRVFLWIIGTLSIVGNVLVLLYRLTLDRENIRSSHSLFVLNLSISDLLMGIYMLIVASADNDFKGSYVYHEKEWKESILCSSAGILCTISNEMSTFLIFMITVDRFIVIVFPLSLRKITWKQSVCISVLFWIVSTLLGIIPQISFESYFKGEFYSKSGVCIALPLTSNLGPGEEYSVSVFIVLNSILFIAILVASILMFNSIRTSGKASSNQTRKRDIAVAKTLSYVVATDFCCWIPVGVMGTLAQLGGHIPDDVYAWVIVFVLPINSAINPFLYTFSYIWRKRKRMKSQANQRHIPNPRQIRKQPENKETPV